MNPNYNDDVLDVVGIVFMAIIYGVFGGIPAFIIVWLFGYLWGIALFATLSFLAVCIHLSSNCKYSDVVGYGYALSGAANILTVALILFSGIYPLLLIAIPLFFCWYLGFQKYRKEAEEYLNEKKKKAQQAALEEKQRVFEEKQRVIKKLDKLKYIFQHITEGYLLIDSNIWMNKDYDILFEVLLAYCKINNGKILFSGIQHDELAKLRHSTYKKRYLASLAFRRIEQFQNSGILKTAGMGLVSSPYSYADPHFIKFFLEETGTLSFSTAFVTDDVELRVRLNACLEERAGKKIFIYTGKQLNRAAAKIDSLLKVLES